MKSILVLLFLFQFFTFDAYGQAVGIGTTNPSDALHIVGAANDDPLRVQVGTATKLRVLNNGGTTIGANNTGGTPANGLYVHGNTGLGISNPSDKLSVDGNINTTGELKANGQSGEAGQVLTSNGNGTMSWSINSSIDNNGNGTWGDCSLNSITDYQPSASINSEVGDRLGWSVAISGDYAMASALEDDEPNANITGSITFYKRNNESNIWEPTQKEFNPMYEASDRYGIGLSIDNDFAIVGAVWDDENGLEDTGSASIYKRNVTTGVWVLQEKITNPNKAANDNFGVRVAISGDYAIVGAYNDSENGVNFCGSATIFKRNSSTNKWESQGKILNTNYQANDQFGNSVSISGDYAIIGCVDDTELGILKTGSATIMKRNPATQIWEKIAKLTNINPESNDEFGRCVSISENYAIVSAPGDDEGFVNNGSVVIFKRNLTTNIWEPQIKLINSDSDNEDGFGNFISFSNEYLIVGTRNDNEQNLTDNGSVSIYKRYDTVWRLVQKFTHPQSNSNEEFGTSVGIDGNNLRFIVGSQGIQNDSGLLFFGKVK